MPVTDPSPLNYLRASRQCEAASLRHLLHSGQLTAAISQLIHELQRERGASNIWLCSSGQLFADELPQRARQVALALAGVMAKLPCLESARPGDSHLFTRVAAALYALDKLPDLRQRITGLQLSHAQAMEQFSQTIRQLLNLAFAMIDTTSAPAISRALIAMFCFMQGKELAGQERALGSAGYATGAFSPQESDSIVALIEAQERYFAQFRQFADALSLQRWHSAVEGENDIERLRRIACTRSQPEAPGSEMALRWYQLMTRRIDSLKVIEDGLAQALMACCRETIALAESRHEAPEEDLPQCLSLLENEPAWSICMAGQDWVRQQAQLLDSGGLSPQLGRSVLELMQAQSQRLQAQDDELAAMRATLNERKHIEQAKVLLMRHRRCGEEQAWQMLRKMAMDQNRRIVDVASALLSVAAAFPQAENG